MAAEDLPHQLHTHQVAQQRVDGDHLEEQEGPSHEHHGVAAGEVIQEVLRTEEAQMLHGCVSLTLTFRTLTPFPFALGSGCSAVGRLCYRLRASTAS